MKHFFFIIVTIFLSLFLFIQQQFSHAVLYPEKHRIMYDSIIEEHVRLGKKSPANLKKTIFSTPPQLDDVPSQHEDNWAVIVSTSKYWHNYRQSNDAFLMYDLLRANGFSDDRIILFVSENLICDRRNPDPGFSSCSQGTEFPNVSTFGADVEIDFSGYGADATQFMRLLLGTQNAEVLPEKTLRSTNKSNVLIFISSHSGEYFTKFQDYEFLSAFELNQVFQTMYRLGRYHRLMFIADTCKGSTLFDQLDAPNLVSISSSGPTDDGMAHTQQFNLRVGGSVADAMSSEIFDFVSTVVFKEEHQHFSEKKKQQTRKSISSIADFSISIREMFDFLSSNRYIPSTVSVSHPKALYKNLGVSDILANGNWQLRDFFAMKNIFKDGVNKNSVKNEKENKLWKNFAINQKQTRQKVFQKSNTWLKEKLEGDFAVWDSL